jgi:cation-transporting ATPase E
VARGLRNDVPDAPTRTVREIIRANVFTRFNFLLGSLLIVILIVGPLQDALFGLVLIANTAVGIVQELRAKRTLDRLAVINAPTATVLRDGRWQKAHIQDLVLDDVIKASPGDQVVVDGLVLEGAPAELDESLLTGESEPVVKRPGNDVLSGSFVASGLLTYRATRVGRDAYATQLAEEARRFTLATSELRAGVDQIIRLVTWLLVPTAALLFVSQLRTLGVSDALRGAVAGTVNMVPEGLVLLLSIAFAVSVVRLGQQNVLVQELPAVETLARVDVLCFDKTGTITVGNLAVTDLIRLRPAMEPAEAGAQLPAVLGAMAVADPAPNATLQAIAEACPAPTGWHPTATVPFSSARKWSAATFDGRGTWVLGAPEVILGASADGNKILRQAEMLATAGNRVILIAAASEPVSAAEPLPQTTPTALVVLAEQIRADAQETIDYFVEEGVHAKVVSGDHPRTVAAVAGRVGVEGADAPVDARSLPQDSDELGALLERRSVFGRVVPQQKRSMVHALQRRGHVVAMTGDGVNDVLALKDADLGVAMGSGSAAARAVAKVVLLDSRFAALPAVVAEGRRVIANIERVARLFLTKTVYALLLSVAVGLASLPFPFLPRHLTLVGSLTIGIPAFFLALEANHDRSEPGFVRRVLAVAIPAGTVAAVATFSAYLLVRDVEGVTLEQSRTAATMTLAGVGLIVLGLVSQPLNRLRIAVLVGATAGFVIVLLVPGLREFFALELPPTATLVVIGLLVAVSGAALVFLWRHQSRRQR